MEALLVFNRKIGSDDEAATVSERTEKILFYTSTTEDDLEEQLERLSLCEALIDLCRSFNAKDPCEAVFMDDHQYSFLEVEPDTWLVICCKSRQVSEGKFDSTGPLSESPYFFIGSQNPKKSPIQKFAPSFRRHTSNEQSSSRLLKTFDSEKKLYKNGKKSAEVEDLRLFESCDPSAAVLLALLQRLYNQFTLLNGPISRTLLGGGKEDFEMESEESWKQSNPFRIKELRKLLRKSRLLQELVDEGDLVPDESQQALLDGRAKNEDELGCLLAESTADVVRNMFLRLVPDYLTQIDFARLHPLYDMKALPFLAVDKHTFLSTQLFMTRLISRFSVIEGVALLYGGQILWNSLPMDQLLPVFQFVEVLLARKFSSSVDGSPSGAIADESTLSVPFSLRAGFLELSQKLEAQKLKKAEDSAETYFLTVFNKEKTRNSKMAVYGCDKTIIVVFMEDIEDRADGSAKKPSILEFCGDFEVFVGNEIVRLSESIGISSQSAREPSSTSSFDSLGGIVDQAASLRNSFRAGSQAQQQHLAAVDPNERYLYCNESNAVVKMSDGWLAPLTEKQLNSQQLQYPGNMKLGFLFTANLITEMNDIRQQFARCQSSQMVITHYVRPNAELQQPGCWVAAVKSMDRQVFLVVDAKHTFEYVSQRLRVLRETTFRSIFL